MAMKEKILGSADFQKVLSLSLKNPLFRKQLLGQVAKKMEKDLIKVNPDKRPLQVQEEKLALGKAMLKSIERAFSKKLISQKAAESLLKAFLGNVFLLGIEKRRKFLEKEGRKPPLFLTISPFAGCNLKCKGCYAASEEALTEKLPFAIFNRIVSEAKEFFGMNFFVISGGEPLLYRDQGKDLLDLLVKHKDCYFLMYTNGTLIDEKMAKRLADLGNLTPAISVEGFEKETDQRRGEGVQKRVLKAMALLKKMGVPFGISVTATRENADLISSSRFFEYYFDELDSLYCWIFQYMPIGREFTLDLMITPEQQIMMNQRIWKEVKEKKRFITDFWNSGCASDGCICAAREGGYFYIDWSGNVMPCVFIPYFTHNIIEVYKKGGDLRTVRFSQFFAELNQWQAQLIKSKGNSFLYFCWKYFPCPIRHWHTEFREILKRVKAKPVNEEAREALEDRNYLEGLKQYGERVRSLVS